MRWGVIYPSMWTDCGGCSSALRHAPNKTVSYQVDRGKRWSTSLQPRTLRLFLPAVPAPLNLAFIPSSHPSPPLRPLITGLVLSSRTHRLSRGRLIDEATFDNGIRNRGVSALSLDTIGAALLQQSETPGGRTGSSGRRCGPKITQLHQQWTLIHLLELIHPSCVAKFSGTLTSNGDDGYAKSWERQSWD